MAEQVAVAQIMSSVSDTIVPSCVSSNVVLSDAVTLPMYEGGEIELYTPEPAIISSTVVKVKAATSTVLSAGVVDAMFRISKLAVDPSMIKNLSSIEDPGQLQNVIVNISVIT